jgi:hypothetical protein
MNMKEREEHNYTLPGMLSIRPWRGASPVVTQKISVD